MTFYIRCERCNGTGEEGGDWSGWSACSDCTRNSNGEATGFVEVEVPAILAELFPPDLWLWSDEAKQFITDRMTALLWPPDPEPVAPVEPEPPMECEMCGVVGHMIYINRVCGGCLETSLMVTECKIIIE